MAILRALSSPYDLDLTAGGYFHNTPAGVAADVQDHITLRNGPSIAGFGLGDQRTTVWFGFTLQKGDATATPDKGLLDIYDRSYSTTQPLYRIKKANNNTSNCRLFMWNGSAWVDNGAAMTAMGGTTLRRIDVELNIATSGGAFRVYVNGTLAGEITGNTNPTGSAGVDWVELFNFAGNPNNSDNVRTSFSAMVVADEDTRGLFVVQRKPNGAGDFTAWTGTYTNVVSSTFQGLPGDSTFIASTEEGQRESFTFASLSAYELEDLVAVVVATRFRLEGEGISAVSAFIETPDGEVVSPAMASDASFRGRAAVFETNADGLPWSYADIEGAQFGLLSSIN